VLDQIVASYPGQVMSIEWHTASGYPLYNAESRTRWFTYPAPYWYNNGWYYATPWLWVDGKQRGYDCYAWEGYVADAVAQPADVEVNLTGNYDPVSRTGQIVAEFVNGTSSSISGTALAAITEDSLYYVAPNGDPWHNHVGRDYIPNQNGTAVTVPANGRDTLALDFTIGTGWNDARCQALVYFQNPSVQPDSSKPVYDGSSTPVLLLTGVKESHGPVRVHDRFTISPNPTTGLLQVNRAGTERRQLLVHDAAGRLVRRCAVEAGPGSSVDLRDLQEGIYLVNLEGGSTTTTKLVIRH
jgi:hypothetical protein